ncbi:UNVERIFIED_CONTAM: hypothetical protein GTU68_017893 [Idotea baltica]|nr:hypothetical protein [Idotea baltica]
MSERKVLNKYYPPDFDPSKIPRAKCPKNRQFTVRLMAPCNMKCLTCGEYIAKAKKFNARKEDVENLSYLGIRIYRFYIKCPGCLAEISFRTDPESTDYVIEAGAHRNFQALKLAEEQAAREDREAREEIESNPMLLLENRTQQSQHEMEVLESLEDLRELNERHAGVDLESMTRKYEEERNMTKEQEEELERIAALKALGYEEIEGKLIKRVSEESMQEMTNKKIKFNSDNSDPSDLLVDNANPKSNKNCLKSKLSGLIKVNNTKSTLKSDIKSKTSTGSIEINPNLVCVNKKISSKPEESQSSVAPPINGNIKSSSVEVPSGLSLLGSYSDSSGCSSEEGE